MSQEPIRILMIVTQMNRAGIENLLMELYREIDRSKIQFDFYTFRMEKGQFDDEISELGGKIYYNPPITIRKYMTLPQQIKQFCLAHPEYKIVHAHMNQWCGVLLKGAKLAGVPVRISHSHNSMISRTLKNTLKDLVKLTTNRYATYKIAVSDKAGKWLYGKKAIARGEVHFWKNTIRYEAYRFSRDVRTKKREELGLGDDLTLVNVGNLRFQKNHPYLFRVFSELLKQQPNSRLLLIGKDESNGEMEQLAEKLGILKNTMFLGSRGDVPELLQAGDVFVFPSFYEGFPCAVLEAQTAGLPCIISDTITREIKVTPLVEMCSIQIDPADWANTIRAKAGAERIDVSDMIVNAGYSLSDSVKNAQNFYLSEMERISHEA